MEKIDSLCIAHKVASCVFQARKPAAGDAAQVGLVLPPGCQHRNEPAFISARLFCVTFAA